MEGQEGGEEEGCKVTCLTETEVTCFLDLLGGKEKEAGRRGGRQDRPERGERIRKPFTPNYPQFLHRGFLHLVATTSFKRDGCNQGCVITGGMARWWIVLTSCKLLFHCNRCVFTQQTSNVPLDFCFVAFFCPLLPTWNHSWEPFQARIHLYWG